MGNAYAYRYYVYIVILGLSLFKLQAHFLSPKVESRRVAPDTRRCACSIACGHRPMWRMAGTWTRCSKCAPEIVARPSGFRRPRPGSRSCCRPVVRPAGSSGLGARIMAGSSWLMSPPDSSCSRRTIRPMRRWSSDGTLSH